MLTFLCDSLSLSSFTFWHSQLCLQQPIFPRYFGVLSFSPLFISSYQCNDLTHNAMTTKKRKQLSRVDICVVRDSCDRQLRGIFGNFWQFLTMLTIVDKFGQFWPFWQFWPFLQFFTILTILTIFLQFLKFFDNWRQFWQFRQLLLPENLNSWQFLLPDN